MKKVFSLTTTEVSHDMIEALEALLTDAKKGKLIGLAFTAMCSDRQFFTDTAGEAHRNPVFTSGMLMCLIFKLLKRVVD